MDSNLICIGLESWFQKVCSKVWIRISKTMDLNLYVKMWWSWRQRAKDLNPNEEGFDSQKHKVEEKKGFKSPLPRFESLIQECEEQAKNTYQIQIPNVGAYLSWKNDTYIWMDSSPIILLGCDWALENLNLFNKF